MMSRAKAVRGSPPERARAAVGSTRRWRCRWCQAGSADTTGGSRPSVGATVRPLGSANLGAPVGAHGAGVVGVVEEAVVAAAQQHQVVEVGAAAVFPVQDVVGVNETGLGTPGEGAAPVAQPQGPAQRPRGGADVATDVQRHPTVVDQMVQPAVTGHLGRLGVTQVDGPVAAGAGVGVEGDLHREMGAITGQPRRPGVVEHQVAHPGERLDRAHPGGGITGVTFAHRRAAASAVSNTAPSTAFRQPSTWRRGWSSHHFRNHVRSESGSLRFRVRVVVVGVGDPTERGQGPQRLRR